MSITLRNLLRQGITQLNNHSDSPALDAELLLCHSLNLSREYLFTWPEKTISQSDSQHFLSLIQQRQTQIPVAYLTGTKEFWSMDFKVSPDVLIPRPDTEILIEATLDKLQNIPNPHILDLGTGSGAIAIALATEITDCHIIATDRSATSLEVATHNVEQHQLGKKITLISSDWFKNPILTNKQFDLIVSNPPYIAADDPHLSSEEIRYEPRNALISGQDGLDDIRHLIRHSPQYLNKDHRNIKGWLLLEHGYNQGNTCFELMKQANYRAISTVKDLSGNDRLTMGQASD